MVKRNRQIVWRVHHFDLWPDWQWVYRTGGATCWSADAGSTWKRLLTLHERAPDGARYITYPFLTMGRDGSFHLVYADFGAGAIQHVRFNSA
jgi:hypothetical protein